VFAEGDVARVGGLTVIRAEGAAHGPEVGIVASRKVGNAVTRNRAKRRVREALRHVELRPDSAYVVVTGQSTVTTAFERLVDDLRRAVVEVNEEQR
jgi:ribonuclease P protein component